MSETLPAPLPPTDAEGGLVFAVHLQGVAAELGEQRLDWAAITPASPPAARPKEGKITGLAPTAVIISICFA